MIIARHQLDSNCHEAHFQMGWSVCWSPWQEPSCASLHLCWSECCKFLEQCKHSRQILGQEGPDVVQWGNEDILAWSIKAVFLTLKQDNRILKHIKSPELLKLCLIIGVWGFRIYETSHALAWLNGQHSSINSSLVKNWKNEILLMFFRVKQPLLIRVFKVLFWNIFTQSIWV